MEDTISGQRFLSATKCSLTKAIKQSVQDYFRESGRVQRGGVETLLEVVATLVLFYLPLLFFTGLVPLPALLLATRLRLQPGAWSCCRF